MLTPKDAWQATLGQLQLQLNRATFDTWLRGSELLAYEDGEFVIRVQHAYAKDWLEKHLAHQITKTLGAIFERTVSINYVVHLPHRHQDINLTKAGPLFKPEVIQAAAKPAKPATAEIEAGAKQPDTSPAPDPEQATAQKSTKAREAQESPSEKMPQADTPVVEDSTKTDKPAPETPESPTVKGPQADTPVAKDSTTTSAAKPAPEAPATPAPDYSEWDPRVTEIRRSTHTAASGPAPFDRRYTFESFITGPSNTFAQAAAKAVAEMPGTRYNPLYIYGGVGLGKTHLLHAIGHVCHTAGRNVLYTTAEAFTNELVSAIRAHTTDELRARYRSVDVLLVDDIQFLAGKSSSEEEFYHTFNAVFSRGGQIVVAGQQHPRQLDKLDDRLRSRFEGGLLADIQAPELDTRLTILRVKSTAQGATLPDDVAGVLARHATDNVRELEGLMTQVIARATLTKQSLSTTLAEQVLNINSMQPRRRATNIAQVLEATATYHQLSMDDLLSKRRTKAVVRARQIAMYLAREETDASLPQIGEALGGRNHSTVLYGYQKIAKCVEADEALRREVSDIRRKLLSN